jgi:hypothetical protein
MSELNNHYWHSEGEGELSRRWLRPLCSSSSMNRRHESTFTGREDRSVPRCPVCVEVASLMGLDLTPRSA